MSRRTPDGRLVATVSRDDGRQLPHLRRRLRGLRRLRRRLGDRLPPAGPDRAVDLAALPDEPGAAAGGDAARRRALPRERRARRGPGRRDLGHLRRGQVLAVAEPRRPRHAFYTDDVLAVAREGDSSAARPGPAPRTCATPALRRLVSLRGAPVRGVLGETPDGVRALVKPAGRDRPLGAIYFLDHRPEHRERRVRADERPAAAPGPHLQRPGSDAGAARRAARAVCSLIAQQRLAVPREGAVGDHCG